MQGAEPFVHKPDCNVKPAAQRGLEIKSGAENRQKPQHLYFLIPAILSISTIAIPNISTKGPSICGYLCKSVVKNLKLMTFG